MKYTRLFILATLLITIGNTAFAQLKHLQDVKELPPHPRILLLKGEEEKIKRNIKTEPVWGTMHNGILNECDSILDLPLIKRELRATRMLHISGEAIRRIFALSYAYRMTGDVKYSERAEKEMLEIAKFEDWNPSHFLDTGEMTMAMAIGYDWLYDQLSSSSRTAIRVSILEKGIDPSFDFNYGKYKRVTNNWNQVCNAGIGFGALAIYEDMPYLSLDILDNAIESLPLVMHEYGPDGTYPEGYGYWAYGTTFNVLFIDAIEKALGSDFGLSSQPGFLKTPNYYKNMIAPSGLSYNYSDCAPEVLLSATMFWFAKKLNDPSLLWNEQKYLQGKDKSYLKERINPAIMIWASDTKMNNIQAPSETIWTGAGINPVAIMRTSWTDPNAIFVGFKGGKAENNHGHMDAGSFVMEANGVRWAMELDRQIYRTLETKGLGIWQRKQDSDRWRVFRYNNYSHNTLTVDSLLHRMVGYAPITSHSSGSKFISAAADLTKVFENQLESSKRGVAIVDEKYVYVRDEIKGLKDKDVVVRWNMLTPAEAKITGKNTIELKKDGKRLTLLVAHPANVTMKTWPTAPTNDFDAPCPGTVMVGFEVSIPAGTSTELSVFLLPQGTKAAKNLTEKSLNNWPSK